MGANIATRLYRITDLCLLFWSIPKPGGFRGPRALRTSDGLGLRGEVWSRPQERATQEQLQVTRPKIQLRGRAWEWSLSPQRRVGGLEGRGWAGWPLARCPALTPRRPRAAPKVALEQRCRELRARGRRLEETLPRRIGSEEQREALSLLCRVHELEVENAEMQSHALLRDGALRHRREAVRRLEQHRSLCEEIIQGQRQIIDGRPCASGPPARPAEPRRGRGRA